MRQDETRRAIRRQETDEARQKTTDNPRHEDPSEIINDILKHITTRHIVIESREQAIKAAVEMLSDDSLLLIAGKGHEEYQEVKGIRYPFSDKEIALLELGNIKN